MELNEVLDAIDEMSAEDLDVVIDHIRSVYRAKKNANAARAFLTLRVDDKVKLVGNYKPKYLNGLTGTVIKKRDTRLEIKLDCGPVGKFRNGVVITNASGLVKIDA